jgi:hypothetical protein
MQYDEYLPVGSRIISCKLKSKTLDKEKIYIVLASNFLAEGGDGFLAFENVISKKNSGIEIVQTMIEFMKTFDVYIPQLYGRVIKVNK